MGDVEFIPEHRIEVGSRVVFKAYYSREGNVTRIKGRLAWVLWDDSKHETEYYAHDLQLVE